MVRKGAEKGEQSVAICIDKDKGSQYALKWAVDQFLTKGQTVSFLHVRLASSKSNNEEMPRKLDPQAKELFLPFRCFCTRKDIKCNEILLEDVDIPKAIVGYAHENAIENLVLGAASKGGLIPRKLKGTDVPSAVTKLAPEFTTIYVINKTKVSSLKTATASAPLKLQPDPLPHPHILQNLTTSTSVDNIPRIVPTSTASDARPSFAQSLNLEHSDSIRSPFTRMGKTYEPSLPEMDISFVSTGRPSIFTSFPDMESDLMTPPKASSVDYDMRCSISAFSPRLSIESGSPFSFKENGQTSRYSDTDDVEAEMKRLRLELKQTMEMYTSACKEARHAKQKSRDFNQRKLEEQQRYEESRLAEEAAMALIEKEKAKTRAAMEAAQAAQRLAELEAQKRKNVEMKFLTSTDDTKKGMDSWMSGNLGYRRYSIEEIQEATNDFSEQLKIGEGGYGPVYKANLDHTEVAIKVLRPDAAQGKTQFQQEVEVLSRIRHPNMVLLLGACPEYGSLVYEYMSNGSLDDCLFHRGKAPPLPWQVRFRIAAEIATGLLFLHQTKPEALVHRDLKPGNILLDRNFVSKIGDVGLAKLVPPSVANAVTQYRMTATAGTFCYIDPEYQQTGMLGTKSDIYSLGVMLLQIITAKSPMGLAHQVAIAIEEGTFVEMLDPVVTDWPMEETVRFAKIALQCAELRKRDRPDLGKVVLPELNRLREFGEERNPYAMYGSAFGLNMHHIASHNEMTMSGMTNGSDNSSVSSTSSQGGR